MFKGLKASRLDSSTEAEMRHLSRIRQLIVDDFAPQPVDATATADCYELVIARHQRVSTVLTCDRSPDEGPAVMTDPPLAQSAVDRSISSRPGTTSLAGAPVNPYPPAGERAARALVGKSRSEVEVAS